MLVYPSESEVLHLTVRPSNILFIGQTHQGSGMPYSSFGATAPGSVQTIATVECER